MVDTRGFTSAFYLLTSDFPLLHFWNKAIFPIDTILKFAYHRRECIYRPTISL